MKFFLGVLSGTLLGASLLLQPAFTTKIEYLPVRVPYAVNRTVIEVVKVPEPYVVERVVTEVVTVNQTVEVEKIVEKVRVVNNEWRYFDSLSELTSWLDEHMVTLLPNAGDPLTADCDDYAERLQRKAFEDGYLMSVQLVEHGRLFDKAASDNMEPHMGNLVMIGNKVYYVEPQPQGFRVIFIINRD